MKKTTKLLAIFLAAVMLLGALPMSAFAFYYDVTDVYVEGLTEPIAGRKASSYGSGEGTGWEYLLNDSYWIETDTKPSGEGIPQGTKYKKDDGLVFASNKYYTFVANFGYSDKYVGSDWEVEVVNPRCSINGLGATRTHYASWGPITAFYCFGKPTTEINFINLTGITIPLAGKSASFNYTIPGGAGYVKDGEKNAAWIETDTPVTDPEWLQNGKFHWITGGSFTFNPDKYYTFYAAIKTSGGYSFASSLTAKINNNTAMLRGKTSRTKGILYCFGKPATAINSVNVTGVTAPVAGATANFNYNIPSNVAYVKDGDQYSAWIETDAKPTTYADLNNGTTYWNIDGSFTFKPNKYYTFCADIRAIDGYDFANPLTAKINNNNASSNAQSGYQTIWYCFGKTGTATINSVTVTGVTAPVAGATASFNYTIPSNLGYVKDGEQNAAWIETDTLPTTNADVSGGTTYWIDEGSFTFKPNKYYTFRADVRANDGYTFSSSLTAKVNNNNANVKSQSGYQTIWYCFGKVGSASKTLSSITVTTQPAKKAYTAGQNFDKSGMVVKANYSDGTSATITNYTVTNGNNLPAGRTSVTISYVEGGITKTTTVSITVKSATTVLKGIEVVSAPNTTELKYKSSASTDGLKVVAKYSDGTTDDVTDKVNVKDFSAYNKKGDYKATVEFEGMTATFNYNVYYSFGQWLIIILLFGWIWY